jgi:predicted Ser/Thr protein kinase
MLAPLDTRTERALIERMEAGIRAGQPAYAHSYQGAVYLCESEGRRFFVKAAVGGGLTGLLRRWMLRREYDVYQRLTGFAGSPHCYGLIDSRYLVLECIDGLSLRSGRIDDRRAYFDTLFAHIRELHRRGVAHADLKRRDNLLVIGGRLPCLVDFGAAIVRKPGFAPFNHYLYELARRFDFNAWAKLKYQGRMEELTPEDRPYYRRTVVEIISRAIKRPYVRLKRRIIGRP